MVNTDTEQTVCIVIRDGWVVVYNWYKWYIDRDVRHNKDSGIVAQVQDGFQL